jgi:hypothetical protein
MVEWLKHLKWYWIIRSSPHLGHSTRWRNWLRHCATNRKVAGLIPDGAIGIFHWHTPSGRTMALELTQPLTEMSTRNTSWGIKAAGASGWQPGHLHVPIVLKSWSLHLLETSEPLQACNGIALPLPHIGHHPGTWLQGVRKTAVKYQITKARFKARNYRINIRVGHMRPRPTASYTAIFPLSLSCMASLFPQNVWSQSIIVRVLINVGVNVSTQYNTCHFRNTGSYLQFYIAAQLHQYQHGS